MRTPLFVCHLSLFTDSGSEPDPALAFSEFLGAFPQRFTKFDDGEIHSPTIIGVIEGSEEALSCEARYVGAKGYRKLSHRRQNVFSTKSDKLYKLFEAYLKLKRARGEFDSADR